MNAFRPNLQFIRSTSLLVGTMVGVGIFGIPFAFAKAGFWIGFAMLLVVAFLTLMMNWMYGEVILRTKERHQLVGYAGLYLGEWAKRIVFFAAVLSSYGALLAYLIIGGEFWANVFAGWWPAQAGWWSFWFFLVGASLVHLKIRTVSWIEIGLSGAFFAIIILIFGAGIFHVDAANYQPIAPELWFFPYGILLFAFSGLVAIPFQREVLTRREGWLYESIAVAVAFVGFAYFVFGFTVVGISGEVTSPEAFDGLVGFVGEWVILLGSLFGGLAVTTSFTMLGSGLREIFHQDYRIPHGPAWALVVLPPALLFWGGMRNFIDVISLAGSVAIGVEAIILALAYLAAQERGQRKPEYELSLPAPLVYVIIAVFVAGVGYALTVGL